MDALYTELPIVAQIGILAAILVGTLAGERTAKRTHWGFALWLGCIVVALPLCVFTDFFKSFPGAFGGAFIMLSSGLLAEAYVRHSRMKELK